MRPSLQVSIQELADSPKKYGIVIAESLMELEEAVNWMSWQRPGWVPTGGPSQAQHGSFFQAISRLRGEKD